MHAALSAQINKTDRNDALGIAQMMRVGLYKAVHVKTPASQPANIPSHRDTTRLSHDAVAEEAAAK